MISNVVDVVAIGKKYFFHGFGVVNVDTGSNREKLLFSWFWRSASSTEMQKKLS